MLHGKNMFQTSYDMTISTMCAYSSSKYTLPHCKCVLRFFAQCPNIDLPGLESDHHNSNVSPTIHFLVYQNIACFNVHPRRPFNKKKQCQLYEASTDSILTAKMYTIKYIFMMES